MRKDSIKLYYPNKVSNDAPIIRPYRLDLDCWALTGVSDTCRIERVVASNLTAWQRKVNSFGTDINYTRIDNYEDRKLSAALLKVSSCPLRIPGDLPRAKDDIDIHCLSTRNQREIRGTGTHKSLSNDVFLQTELEKLTELKFFVFDLTFNFSIALKQYSVFVGGKSKGFKRTPENIELRKKYLMLAIRSNIRENIQFTACPVNYYQVRLPRLLCDPSIVFRWLLFYKLLVNKTDLRTVSGKYYHWMVFDNPLLPEGIADPYHRVLIKGMVRRTRPTLPYINPLVYWSFALDGNNIRFESPPYGDYTKRFVEKTSFFAYLDYVRLEFIYKFHKNARTDLPESQRRIQMFQEMINSKNKDILYPQLIE